MKTLSDIARLLGKQGGLKTKENHDPDYFRRTGKRGAEIRWKKKITDKI